MSIREMPTTLTCHFHPFGSLWASMVSQDDRNKIGTLTGIHSHASIIPDHAKWVYIILPSSPIPLMLCSRWPKVPPKKIEPRLYHTKGNSAVSNPYVTISQQNLPHRTNPMANPILLSGIASGSNKARRIDLKRRNVSNPVSQGKGKGLFLIIRVWGSY